MGNGAPMMLDFFLFAPHFVSFSFSATFTGKSWALNGELFFARLKIMKDSLIGLKYRVPFDALTSLHVITFRSSCFYATMLCHLERNCVDFSIVCCTPVLSIFTANKSNEAFEILEKKLH